MKYLNWGSVQHETVFMRGCKVVDCSGHGGIVVSSELLSTHPFFEKIKSYDFSKFRLSSGVYAFEEDLDANIILACLPHAVLSNHYPSCSTVEGFENFKQERLIAVKNAYPEIFTLLTGIELSIFDSQSLFQNHLSARTDLIYRYGSFSGYNVPNGYICITVRVGEDESRESYLIPKAQHDLIKLPVGRLGYAPLDPSILNMPFELDAWTPSSIKKDPQEDRFYISHTRRSVEDTNQLLVLAYNYQTQKKLCFEMTEAYYCANKLSDHGIQVNAELDVIDQPFIVKAHITAEQFIAK